MSVPPRFQSPRVKKLFPCDVGRHGPHRTHRLVCRKWDAHRDAMLAANRRICPDRWHADHECTGGMQVSGPRGKRAFARFFHFPAWNARCHDSRQIPAPGFSPFLTKRNAAMASSAYGQARLRVVRHSPKPGSDPATKAETQLQLNGPSRPERQGVSHDGNFIDQWCSLGRNPGHRHDGWRQGPGRPMARRRARNASAMAR